MDTQPLQQPPELLRTKTQHLFFASGPLVFPALQPFVQQDKAVRIPIQSLETVCPSATEQEQSVGKRIQSKPLLNDAHQPVNPTAQVCVPAGDIYMLYPGWVEHLTLPYAVPGAEAPDHIPGSPPPSRKRCAAQELAFELKPLRMRQLESYRE